MKLTLFGNQIQEIEPLVKKLGFEIVKTNPDFVVSYGGDGTLMRAEHQFPGTPKIVLRASRICKKCSRLTNEEVLKRIKAGHYNLDVLWKLELKSGHGSLLALNDITVHNQDPRHAIRYRLWVNDEPIGDEIIGDGIVAATPFGSTGYYRSITDSYFAVGLGLAFNNSTEAFDHMVLEESSVLRLRIVRGPANAYADNQEKFIELSIDEELIIQKADLKQAARLVQPEE